jgi:dTDP-4-amino-4,6-dideoxygalactose transaminase
MRMDIPHSQPTLDANDAKIVMSVINSGHIAQGEKVSLFERRIARFQNVKHAAATSSGTAALHLALLALGIKKGDNVIIPSFVCTALLNAVCYTGADVRVADVGGDFNIDATSVRTKINKRTKAIIVPHMFGLPADLGALLKCGVPVIEDCAQAIGARYQRKRAGSFGVLSIYSFYATKMLTTGEGGMVTSDDRALMDRVRDLRDYDEKKDSRLRFNYKMTDMQAAMGIHQLSQLPKWIGQRKKIAATYDAALKGCGLKLPEQFPGREHVYFRYVVQTDDQRGLLHRLRSKGIHVASPVFRPIHKYLQLKGCPVTDRFMSTAVSLPIYPTLSAAAVRYIAEQIKR